MEILLNPERAVATARETTALGRLVSRTQGTKYRLYRPPLNFRRAVVISDALTMFVAIAIGTLYEHRSGALTEVTPWWTGFAYFPLWIFSLARCHLYAARHVATRRQEIPRIVRAAALGAAAVVLTSYGIGDAVGRRWIGLMVITVTGGLVIEREFVRRWFTKLRRQGRCVRHVAIAGYGPESRALAAMFAEQPELGYGVVAFVTEHTSPATANASGPPLITLGPDVAEDLRLVGATTLVVATTDVAHGAINRLVRRVTDAGIHVELSSSLCDIESTRLLVKPLGRFPVVYVEPVRRDPWRLAAKRTFDVVLSSIVLMLTAPLLAAAVVAVRITSPGPALFRQERVGFGGQTFMIFKLRSMYVDADQRFRSITALPGRAGVVKLRNDPRVTPVGRLLRKLSLDELPQLVNVLRGNMSLVGPRPEQPCEIAHWSPEQFDRLRVRPGLTGMWQVSGRSEARDSKDRWDLYYVDNWSICRDLAILAKTLPVVLSSRGAY